MVWECWYVFNGNVRWYGKCNWLWFNNGMYWYGNFWGEELFLKSIKYIVLVWKSKLRMVFIYWKRYVDSLNIVNNNFLVYKVDLF